LVEEYAVNRNPRNKSVEMGEGLSPRSYFVMVERRTGKKVGGETPHQRRGKADRRQCC
jgi:hypothetical protein